MNPIGFISVVTLIRTDTTLDHSQEAEKVCVYVVGRALTTTQYLSKAGRQHYCLDFCSTKQEKLVPGLGSAVPFPQRVPHLKSINKSYEDFWVTNLERFVTFMLIRFHQII